METLQENQSSNFTQLGRACPDHRPVFYEQI
jgi:hypothetical protein